MRAARVAAMRLLFEAIDRGDHVAAIQLRAIARGADSATTRKETTMTTTLKLAAVALALSLAACGDNIHPAIAPDVACAEQADAWCAADGFAGSVGCARVYVNWCGPQGPRVVEEDAQIECLAAIDAATDHDVVPHACHLTWAIAR